MWVGLNGRQRAVWGPSSTWELHGHTWYLYFKMEGIFIKHVDMQPGCKLKLPLKQPLGKALLSVKTLALFDCVKPFNLENKTKKSLINTANPQEKCNCQRQSRCTLPLELPFALCTFLKAVKAWKRPKWRECLQDTGCRGWEGFNAQGEQLSLIGLKQCSKIKGAVSAGWSSPKMPTWLKHASSLNQDNL